MDDLEPPDRALVTHEMDFVCEDPNEMVDIHVFWGKLNIPPGLQGQFLGMPKKMSANEFVIAYFDTFSYIQNNIG